MLIGICGTSYSGQDEVAKYLILQGFKRLRVRRNPQNIETDQILSIDNDNDKKIKLPPTPVIIDEEIEEFNSTEQLLEFVTAWWQEKFLITHISDLKSHELLASRPFFLLLSVQASLTVRYDRYLRQVTSPQLKPISLDEFMTTSDTELYDRSAELARLMSKSRLQIINNGGSIELLYVKLSNLNLTDESRLRPSWDAYFMQLANLAARRSNCMKRRVGCVLVRGRRVIATGYNGTPRGVLNCNQGGCERCNLASIGGSSLATCLCLHAEENALLEAGRERVSEEAVLYCNTCPCLTCSIKIVQMGLKEVVYSQSYHMDEKSYKVLRQGGVTLRKYWPPEEGIVII
ncbi:cytidine deaminase-like protein [Lipomyces japonicus]|uniref:cytidine deaminase-like protein n=1 Tax=Lipomyces japonicus TaxID=56871 RepID=UPI0034CF474D